MLSWPPTTVDDPPSSSSSSLSTSWAEVDPSSIDGLVNRLYGAVSFGPGEEPDADALASLFSPGARIVEVAGDAVRTLTLDDFLGRVRSAIAQGRVSSLDERELARRTDVFGAIAQVFGTYERRSDDRVTRGINALQLRNDGRRWWIESLMWTDEREDCPLPTTYLPLEDRGDEPRRRRRARTFRTQPYRTATPR
jgi:hypothetical protein